MMPPSDDPVPFARQGAGPLPIGGAGLRLQQSSAISENSATDEHRNAALSRLLKGQLRSGRSHATILPRSRGRRRLRAACD